MKETVNLRAVGTDKANPTAGTLVGTVVLDMPDSGRLPDDEPSLLISREATRTDRTIDRIFVFVRGTFAYGGSVPAEYVEVVPTTVAIDPPSA